jgi:hypothetical protein
MPEEAEQNLVLGADSLHFIGPPGSCSAFADLHNRSAQKLNLRRLPIIASGVMTAENLPLTEVELSAQMAPGASSRARLKLALHPQTPPGRYEAEVVVGKEPRKATIQIVEAWDVAVLPESLSIKKGADENGLSRTVLVSNRGNMPWHVPDAVFAPLKEQEGLHRNIFQSLRASGANGLTDVLNDFVRRMQAAEVGPATVRIDSSGDVLKPGETRELAIEISLPKELKKHRRYSGSISFENAQVALDIEVFEKTPAKTRSKK